MRRTKFILLTFLLTAVSFASYSQEGASTITVTKMGTLGTILDQKQKNTITAMVLKGEINKADFDVMKSQMPNLTYLDLKDVQCEDDKIPNNAFGDGSSVNSNINITTIILPQSIKTIELGAFRYCTALTDPLNLPDGLTTVGDQAFRYTTGFNGPLNFPDGLKTIGHSAFRNNYFSGALIIPNEVTTIGGYAFFKCLAFKELSIGNKIETIGEKAFQNSKNISGNVNFPESLSSIGESAFAGCTGVNAFQFPHTTPIQHETKMLPAGATVHVPTSAVSTYKATDGWKDYNIVGY